MAKHLEKHPEYIEGCFGCKAASFVGTYFPQGREQWHNADSVKKQENDHVRELRDRGVPFERAT